MASAYVFGLGLLVNMALLISLGVAKPLQPGLDCTNPQCKWPGFAKLSSGFGWEHKIEDEAREQESGDLGSFPSLAAGI